MGYFQTSYDQGFWADTVKCLLLGLMTGGATSGLLLLMVFGHGFQALFVFVGTFVGSSIIFSKIVKKNLAKVAENFKNLDKFDRQIH
jgi:hypothetical protein